MTPLPTPLITVADLHARLQRGEPLRVLDASFDLMDPSAGRRAFESGHLPGAQHVDLDLDLSEKGSGPRASGGRHPLPSRESFAQRLGAWGLTPQTPLVVLDRQGLNYVGRLWWMLRWCGHGPVAVLDGGWGAWVAAGLPVETGPGRVPAPNEAVTYTLGSQGMELIDTQALRGRLGRADTTVIDARAPARFRGETEPLDPVAGHMPGALNRPFGLNLGEDGRLKPAAVLRQEFERLLGSRDPAGVVHHCGSGVSAVPNLLAMTVAGLPAGALYAGSWSEWCTTPDMPCARSV